MAERYNGTSPHRGRKHGSNQRGVVAVPRGPRNLDYLRQSQADKAKLIQANRLRKEAVPEKDVGYGNKNLPVYKHKQEIVNLIDNYKAVILGGPTGSGKSTQVPQYLLEAGYDKVYMLVPRRIIADGLYDRLIDELSEHLGEEDAAQVVGVAHGERSIHSEDSRIVVMTPNTFARMEADIRAKHSGDKVAIISDEIHEANIYTEIATGVAAQAVNEYDTWRLIAASATHNTSSLKPSFSELNNGFVPTVNIEGRPFFIETHEAPDESPMQVYVRMGTDHEKSMIFTSGKSEIDHIIEETRNALEMNEPGSSEKVIFRKLHGELNDIELDHIDDPIPEGGRLVIVSSPAGMSGITIPGVTFVVTDGTINRSELDDDNVSGLARRYLSQAEITQQMGRAGRDVSGGVAVLAAPTAVNEDKIRARGGAVEFEQMSFIKYIDRDEFGPAEIYNSNLSQVVLTVASLDRSFSDINKYLPHQVAPSEIIKAEETLARLGALDDDDRITQLGRDMSSFQVRPELSRGVVESMRQNRSLQQLTRIAFIAAALETGGVQDFSKDSGTEWRQLLRPTTADDMIAQLDLATTKTPSDLVSYTEFISDYDLSYKRMVRSRKVAKKMLHTMGIRLENVVLSPPTSGEEDDVRRDLAAGFIDFTYRKSKIIDRRQHYQNIHGDEHATQRFISNRSLVSQVDNDYVAGFPRWYETATRTGGRRRHDVVEQLMPIDPDIIGEYARQNQILGRTEVDPLYTDGRVVERYQPMFGSIPVGRIETGVIHEDIPQRSQDLLVHHILQSPGTAQKALREIVDELEYYQKRYSPDQLTKYMKTDAPVIITKDTIKQTIVDLAKQTRSAYGIDQGLARYVFHNNVSIHRYFNEEVRVLLREQAPDEIVIGKTTVTVHYDKGVPYITVSRIAPKELLAGKELLLPDGREIKVQINQPGSGKARVSASEL